MKLAFLVLISIMGVFFLNSYLKTDNITDSNKSSDLPQKRGGELLKSSSLKDDMRDDEDAESIYSDARSAELDFIESNPKSAYEKLLERKSSFSDEDYISEQIMILHTLAEKDPSHAASLLATLDSEAMRNQLALSLALSWPGKDAEEAFRWFENLDKSLISDDSAVGSYVAIITGYSKENPETSVQIFDQLESKEIQSALVGALAKNYAKKDTKEAMDWLVSLDSESLRNDGVKTLIVESGPSVLVSATKVMVENEDRFSGFNFSEAFYSMTETDPSVAVESLSGLTDAGKQSTAAEALISSWVISDPVKAKDWLASLPAGPVLNGGVTSVVHLTALETPKEAIDWANRISDEGLRIDLLTDVVTRTKAENLNDVIAHLSKANLTTTEHSKLNELITERVSDTGASFIFPE